MSLRPFTETTAHLNTSGVSSISLRDAKSDIVNQICVAEAGEGVEGEGEEPLRRRDVSKKCCLSLETHDSQILKIWQFSFSENLVLSRRLVVTPLQTSFKVGRCKDYCLALSCSRFALLRSQTSNKEKQSRSGPKSSTNPKIEKCHDLPPRLKFSNEIENFKRD